MEPRGNKRLRYEALSLHWFSTATAWLIIQREERKAVVVCSDELLFTSPRDSWPSRFVATTHIYTAHFIDIPSRGTSIKGPMASSEQDGILIKDSCISRLDLLHADITGTHNINGGSLRPYRQSYYEKIDGRVGPGLRNDVKRYREWRRRNFHITQETRWTTGLLLNRLIVIHNRLMRPNYRAHNI